MYRTVLSFIALAVVLAAPVASADADQTRVAAGQSERAAKKPAGRAATRPTTSGVVNINTAPASELEGLPGIGAKTALRIVEYRQKNGPFKKIEELMNVRGIGEKNFLKLKPQISVGGAKADDNQASR